ncbi:MAG TPA: diacylglycerol kinase family protein [Bacteroidales bacterium]|nr:diacylglycerol kinase family protein [Bacteroidales bacterium]
MSDNKWLIIVNPHAGAGKCGRDWPVIEKILREELQPYELAFTSRRFHAMIITRKKISEGFKKIVVVGGDGTLNEVINGLFAQKQFKTTDITLGMIPVGTGNDWSRMFGIPFDYHEAVKTIRQGTTFIQDAGRVVFTKQDRKLGRYFVNIAGIGFDAIVTRRSNELKEQGRSSKVLYFMNIFAKLFGYKHFQASMSIDGMNYQHDIFSMNIGICKYSGGGMMQVPDAIADDGQFDLTIIKKMGKIEVLRSLPKLYNGQIKKHPRVQSFIGKNIVISSTRSVYLETDGESLGHTPLEFEIIPRSVRIITGKKSA